MLKYKIYVRVMFKEGVVASAIPEAIYLRTENFGS